MGSPHQLPPLGVTVLPCLLSTPERRPRINVARFYGCLTWGGGGISPGPVTLPQPKAEVLPTSFNQLLSPSSAMIAGNQEPCLSHEMITSQHLLTADRCRGTVSHGVPQGSNITAEHSSAEEVFCREQRVDKMQSPGRSSLVWLHLRRAFKAPRATDSSPRISETSHPRGPGSDCEVPLTCVTPGKSHRLN